MLQIIKLSSAWRAIRAAISAGSANEIVRAVIEAGAVVDLTPDDNALIPAIDAAKRGEFALAGELAVELTIAVLERIFTPARMSAAEASDAIEDGLNEMVEPVAMAAAGEPDATEITPGQVILAVRVGTMLLKWIRERRMAN